MPDTDDADEVERLRVEVENLKQTNAELLEGTSVPAARKHRIRVVACIALVALGSLLVPVSILGVWLHNQVTNTDRYVATVTPLASDPDIQAAIANRVTNTLYDQVDVPAEVKSVLPEQAGFLATPIASGLRTVVHEIVLRIVQSDQFATLWVAANRFAHKQVVDVLTSDKAPKGAVVIDLTGVAKAATSKLESAGLPLFDRISSGSSQRKLEFEVFRSDDVANIQSSFKLFEKIATILPWLTILILAAAVFVAPNRRRGLVWAASGFTIGAALILIGLTVGRSIYLAALPRGTSRPANEAFFDTLTRFVRSGTRTVVAVGLVVLLAALIFGPSGPAVGIRRFFSRITGRLGARSGRAWCRPRARGRVGRSQHRGPEDRGGRPGGRRAHPVERPDRRGRPVGGDHRGPRPGGDRGHRTGRPGGCGPRCRASRRPAPRDSTAVRRLTAAST